MFQPENTKWYPMKHFLPENTQDQMNAFDGKKVDFFAKI